MVTRTYMHICNIFDRDKSHLNNQSFISSQDIAHAVSIVEKVQEWTGMDSTPVDTSCLLSVVSYAITVSTEEPITIVIK